MFLCAKDSISYTEVSLSLSGIFSETTDWANESQISLGESMGLYFIKFILIVQGPVVQSVVSLTSSLRVISLTILADSIYNILIFFAEKM